jgi:hypothetical protein
MAPAVATQLHSLSHLTARRGVGVAGRSKHSPASSSSLEALRRQRLQREAAERARSVTAVAVSLAARVSAGSRPPSSASSAAPEQRYHGSFGNAPPRRAKH